MAIKFDLSVIPQDATITKATLGVFCLKSHFTHAQYMKKNDIQVHKMTKMWEENTNDWETNWNTYGNAMEQTHLGSKEWDIGMNNVWYDFDVTDVVREYYANPSQNFGFMLCNYIGYEFTTHEGSMMLFTSSESTSNSQRPKLTVEYETGSGIIPLNQYSFLNNGPYQVVVTDVKGRKLTAFSAKTIRYIDNVVSLMSAGVKLVHIKSDNAKFTRKVVVR